MKFSDLNLSPANSTPETDAPLTLPRLKKRNPVLPGERGSSDAPVVARRSSRSVRIRTVVSGRKMAARMWHLAADASTSGGGGGGRILECGLINRLGFERQSLWQLPTFVTEGATKWDRIYSKDAGSALQAQLILAQTRIHKLETDRRSLKKKVLHLLRELVERTSWAKKEHRKVHILVDELNTERRDCERRKNFNSKLLDDLTDATLVAKEFMLRYEKEQKKTDLLDKVCYEQAKKIEEGKTEVEALKKESARIHEEIEEERKMLQMAEAWREERVQMKMFDAKLILEEKYRQMNNLVADLEAFLSSREVNLGMIEMSEPEVIREAANSVGIQGIKEFPSLPSKSNISYSTDEDCQKYQSILKQEPETDQLQISTPEFNELNKEHIQRNSNLSYKPEGKERERNTGQESLSSKINKICSVSSNKPKNNMQYLFKLWKSSVRNGDVHKKILVESNGKLLSTDSRNPHIIQGMRGCTEWP
ncbi:hypothetical protein LguiA_015134 [Lonicera macranthoides]